MRWTWPTQLDLRSLALWRMGLAGVVLLAIFLRLRDLTAFYGDQGVLSRQSVWTQGWQGGIFQLFLSAGDTPGLLFLFAVWAVAATFMLVGYQTRLACFITWYFVVSVQLRNPMIMDGGDDFLRVLLFWTPFLPLSARWSLDAKRNPNWEKLPNAYSSVATTGIYLQFFLLYLFAAILKTGEDWWETGDALYYALSIDQFSTTLGQNMLAYPEALRVLTRLALGLEFLLPILLLVSLRSRFSRLLFLLLAVSFHLAIAALMHFGIFMLIMIVSLVVFVPGEWLPEAAVGEYNNVSLPPAYHLERPLQLFAGFVLFYLIYVNLYSIRHDHKLAPWAKVVATYLYQHQHWHFFAPYPFREDGYFQILVQTTDGRVIDILQRGEVDETGRPLLGSARFPNQRWRRWLQHLVREESDYHDLLQFDTLTFLVKDWQRKHPDDVARSARLIFVLELSQPPGVAIQQVQTELARWQAAPSGETGRP